MKSYKLANSKEVQEKAERLGIYKWSNKNKDGIFMFIDGSEWWTEDSYKSADKYQEITQADFLALPEPLKVGDWVKYESDGLQIIFKAVQINSNNTALWGSGGRVDGYKVEKCTKLTPEQIKILVLED